MKRFLLFLTCVLTLFGLAKAETYTLELTANSLGFDSSSYANNNGEHSVNAESSNGKTMAVTITSSDVYKQSKTGSTDMQWKKGAGYLQNKTDLGNIISIKIESSDGSYAVTEGTSEGPNKTVTNNNGLYNFSGETGFFKIKEANTATGIVSKITITFEIGDISNEVIAPSYITFDPVSGSNITTLDKISITADGTDPIITYSIDNQEFDLTYSEPFSLNSGQHTIYAKAENDKGEITSSASFIVTFVEKPTIPGIGSEFELISSTDELKEGKFYIIVARENDINYAVSTELKSSKILSTPIDTNDELLKIKEDNTVVFQPVYNDSKWIWYVANEGYEGKAFGKGSGSTDTAIANPSSDNFKSSVDFNDNNSANIVFASDRKLVGYNGTNGIDFRVYNSNSGLNVYIYKLLEPKSPALPLVTLGSEELITDGESIILSGEKISYVCERAEKIHATYNNAEITDNPFTITESGILKIYGTNAVGNGPEFTYTFTVDVKEYVPAIGSNFKQVTNPTELEDGYYIIATAKDDTALAMSIPSVETGIVPGTEVTLNKVNTENPFNVIQSTDNTLIVKIQATESNSENQAYTIKTVNYKDWFTSQQKYISAETGKTSIILENNPVNASIILPTIGTSSDKYTGNANIYLFDSKDRTISNNGTNFGYYTSGTIQLYKYSPLQLFAPTFENIKLRLTENETYQLPTYENAPALNYTIKDGNDVISIENNEIKALSPGEALVSVTWAESEYWFGGSAEFLVTVLPPIVDISETFSFRYPDVRGKVGIGVLSQAVYYEGDGNVSYSIDPDGEIYIDPQTGMIRPEDIVNAVIGKVYIVNAHVDATDFYTSGDAQYSIIIEAPAEGTIGNTTELFNNDNWEDGKKLPTSYDKDSSGKPIYKLEEYTSKITGITYNVYAGLSFNQSNSFSLQLNKEAPGYVSFIIPNKCKSLTITKGAGSAQNPLVDISLNGKEETLSINSPLKYEIPDDLAPNSEIKITANGSAIKIASIEFEIPESKVPEAGLAFNVPEGQPYYINAFADETISIPYELLHATGMKIDDVIFDIDEIDEVDDAETYEGYTITANSFNDISIDVNYPGVYTFRAEYNAEKLVKLEKIKSVDEAKFLDGMAILRLNVFPRLSVLPTESTEDGTLSEDPRTEVPELTLVEAVLDGNGNQSANIVLPTIDQLNDTYKYSTLKVTKVVVKHGEEETSYTIDGEETMPEIFEFTEDGYVTYTLVYAGTDDFFIESTVHVILMPKTTVDRSQENQITLTSSKNSKLKYAYVYGNGKKEVRRHATSIPEEEWESAENGSMTFNDLESLKEEGVTAIFYKSEKDLNDNSNIDKALIPENSILADDGTIVLATVDVTLNMGEPTKMPFKTDSHTYSMEGIFSFSGTDQTLEEGTDFTVTVTPLNDAEGWATTDATSSEDLASAYEKALNAIQGGETGLYNQYTILGTEYVDGFYTNVSNISATESGDNSFTVNVDLPCSGVYVVTVSPVSSSEFNFTEQSTNFTVYPNLEGTFGTLTEKTGDKGFNIEGYTFQNVESEGNPVIYFPETVDDKAFEYNESMTCYIPGTYFASEFTVVPEYTVQKNLTRKANVSEDNSVYFADVNLTALNSDYSSMNVTATVKKNGAEGTYTFKLIKNGTSVGSPTGVEGIGEDDAEVEYFTIDGVKVQNPDKGIYIVRKGNKTYKVVK